MSDKQRIDTQSESQVSPRELLASLASEWKVIVFFPVAGLVAALLYVSLATPLYRVTMELKAGIVGYDQNAKPIHGWSLGDTPQAIIESYNVGSVVAWFNSGHYRRMFDDGMYKEAVARKLSAKSSPVTNILSLSILSADPESGEKFLGDVYRKWVDHASSKDGERWRVEAMGNLEKIKSNLQKDAEKKEKLAEQTLNASRDQIERAEEALRMVNQQRAVVDKALARIGEEKVYEIFILENARLGYEHQAAKHALDIENFRIEMQKAEDYRELARQQVSKLNEKIALINDLSNNLTPAVIANPPAASEHPVCPQKGVVVFLSTISGAFLGMIIAVVMAGRKFTF